MRGSSRLKCLRSDRRFYPFTVRVCTPLERQSPARHHGGKYLRRSAMGLADQQCIPCRGGVPPLPRERIDALLEQLEAGWSLTTSGHLLRTFEFRDFAQALAFANRVGDIAEEQGHHPDLHVG